MKKIAILLTGILFGIVMTKAETISWYRIFEMFKFQSFHMYGVIASTVLICMVSFLIIKKFKLKDISGKLITFEEKPKFIWAPLFGGSIFGLGWALAGSCPGSLYVLLGQGFLGIGIMILSALAGTLLYGAVKHKLPH
ncbi:YeeE/YedE family protein [Fibrobacterales bacterium]|nr:YeeE/YedE family protein [Fibrobacterales bacterium]